jgi:hypothetical protein
MEGLRWWLVLLTAVMFSMSGCATAGAPPQPFSSSIASPNTAR